MLRFDVYIGGAPAKEISLGGAYVFGQDAIPVRADIVAANSQISCMKRIPGACGLAILWTVGKNSRLMLTTTRLPERSKPYNLNLELARAQVGKLLQKREDWNLFDPPHAEAIDPDFLAVESKFIQALQCTDPSEAARLADESLEAGVILGEKMTLLHSESMLSRRKVSAGGLSRVNFGCTVDLFSLNDLYQDAVKVTFDYLQLPMPWKYIEPQEGKHQYTQIDTWMDWAAKCRKPILGGPLLGCEPAYMPEWLYLWEHDYDSLRDLIYEHIQKIIKKYDRHVRWWNVVSAIHAYNNFNLSFEQMMELTRMSCLLVKKLSPNSLVMIELVLPWGEYYARNQRTIPPMLYADMAVQSGIKFDAFGVKVCMGVPVDGLFMRDLLQISSLLDEFASMGKPVHITGAQVPSDIGADPWDFWGGQQPVTGAGQWHTPWTQRLQAEWLQAFYRIAFSKPYIESVCWRDLADYEGHYIPHGGLCRNNMDLKLSYKELRNFKVSMMARNSVPKA